MNINVVGWKSEKASEKNMDMHKLKVERRSYVAKYYKQLKLGSREGEFNILQTLSIWNLTSLWPENRHGQISPSIMLFYNFTITERVNRKITN